MAVDFSVGGFVGLNFGFDGFVESAECCGDFIDVDFFVNGFVDDEVFDEEGFLGVGGGGFVDLVVIV